MKKISNWSNAIAHIDCDAFYASCEALRHPELRGRPICVLSSQNAIVVAKSYDAKALGITTGMPVWEARKLVPGAVFLAADFRYYGLISTQLFAILRSYSPDVEVYSIDEGFIDMNGIRTLWRRSFAQLADDIRQRVAQQIGITVSVGIANTRTLAKMASEANKPNGSTIVPGRRIERFLADIDVGDIPGVGRNRAALLRKFDIRTALAFVQLDDGMMHRLLGRHGMQLKHELSGCSVLPLELKPTLPKSVARTASMGEVTNDAGIILAHLSRHVMRLVAELVAKRLLSGRLYLFLTLASFERTGMHLELEVPSNSLKRIMQAVKCGFSQLFVADERYRGCGVVALKICRDRGVSNDLFGVMDGDVRQADLMRTVNAVNRRYGNRMLMLASTSRLQQRSPTPRFHYPLLIAH